MDNPEKLATRRRKTKQKHNTICVGHHYTHTNTNNVNKTSSLLQINHIFLVLKINKIASFSKINK
jgi:hypothetical protein